MNPEEIDLRAVSFTAELPSCVPGKLARRYRTLPIAKTRHELVLAMEDVSDLDAIDSMKRSVGCDVTVCVAQGSQLDEFIGRLYGEDSEP